MKTITLILTLLLTTAFPEALKDDAYSKRIGKDFIENTVFRFRTRFHRTYVETDDFKTLLSKRVDSPPHLDGLMEDDCWKIADHTKSAWVQWVSKEVTKKQSVAYVCHDDKNLYMAIVAEEPSLKTVRMMSQHPGGRATWTTAGNGDGVELFLELGGVGGTGQVFQFIFNIHQDVAYDGLFPPYVPFVGATNGKPGTGYRLKGTLGGKRWTVELAFPYKGFNTDKTTRVDYTYEGPPRRGEVWGLRFVRNGPKVWGGEARMRSNWTYNPTTSNHIPFPTGIVVFEDRNALHNGGMNEVEPKTDRPTFWKTKAVGDLVKGSLAFNEEEGQAFIEAETRNPGEAYQVTQKFGMLPNVGYRLKAKLKKISGTGTVSVGIDKPWLKFDLSEDNEWEIIEEDYFSDPQQRDATFYISVTGGTAKVAIDQLSVEQQVYGAPTGAKCLTGNSPRPDLNYGFDPENEKAAHEALKDMKYTYRNPLNGEERFPFRQSWGAGWTNGAPDPGGTTGWIPFTKGSLTGSDETRDLVYWSHARPTAGWRPYPEGHEVILDFGKDFYFRALEMLPSESVLNVTVSVKQDGGDRFYLSRKLAGAGVLNPRSPVLFGRLRRINSVARYIKLWFVGVQGVYFVRVWGEEKGEHEGISRFRWKEGLVVPQKKYIQFEKLKGPVLMPTPQEVKWGDGEFLLRDGVPILYKDSGKSRSTATHLRDEVKARLGIDLKLVEEKPDEPDASGDGAIVIGEAVAGGLSARLAGKRGWKISYERPGNQGYFLSSRPSGILLTGFDQAGTFYGVQTLLQLFVRRDYGTAAARSVEIRDWPYIPIRLIEFRSPGKAPPAFVRGLAMLKGNAMGNHGRPETARMCDNFFILPGWNYCGHQGGSPLEMEDDENYVYLAGPMGYGRVNCCPSHLQRYEYIHNHAKRTGGMNMQGINLGLDEMDLWRGGARWNSDRRCLRRGMGGDELFTEMILRSYDIFRLYNTRTALLDTMLMSAMQGGNGSYHNMYRAFELLPTDVHVCA